MHPGSFSCVGVTELKAGAEFRIIREGVITAPGPQTHCKWEARTALKCLEGGVRRCELSRREVREKRQPCRARVGLG